MGSCSESSDVLEGRWKYSSLGISPTSQAEDKKQLLLAASAAAKAAAAAAASNPSSSRSFTDLPCPLPLAEVQENLNLVNKDQAASHANNTNTNGGAITARTSPSLLSIWENMMRKKSSPNSNPPLNNNQNVHSSTGDIGRSPMFQVGNYSSSTSAAPPPTATNLLNLPPPLPQGDYGSRWNIPTLPANASNCSGSINNRYHPLVSNNNSNTATATNNTSYHSLASSSDSHNTTTTNNKCYLPLISSNSTNNNAIYNNTNQYHPLVSSNSNNNTTNTNRYYPLVSSNSDNDKNSFLLPVSNNIVGANPLQGGVAIQPSYAPPNPNAYLTSAATSACNIPTAGQGQDKVLSVNFNNESRRQLEP
ncbi:unnamed protein product, partial [Cuscuta epithymum]